MLGLLDHIANGVLKKHKHGAYLARGRLKGTSMGLKYVEEVFARMSVDNYCTFVFTSEPEKGEGEMGFAYRYRSGDVVPWRSKKIPVVVGRKKMMRENTDKSLVIRFLKPG